jgi:hypothetical protein
VNQISYRIEKPFISRSTRISPWLIATSKFQVRNETKQTTFEIYSIPDSRQICRLLPVESADDRRESVLR